MKQISKKKKVFIFIVCILIVIASVIAFFSFKNNCLNMTCVHPCALAINCECNKETCDCIYTDENNQTQKITCPNNSDDN